MHFKIDKVSAMIDHPLHRWQEVILLLIAITTPLFVNLWVEQQFEASKIWLLRTLIWLLAVLWLAGWLSGLSAKRLALPIRNLTLTLVLLLSLSTFLSTNRYIAIFGTLDRANGLLTQLSYLLLFLFVATQIDEQQSQRLRSVIIFTAVPICLLGLAQAYGWQPLPVFTDSRSLLTTTLGRANFTGAYLAMVLPLAIVAARLASDRWQRVTYGTIVALVFCVIALTQARAAWIAAIM